MTDDGNEDLNNKPWAEITEPKDCFDVAFNLWGKELGESAEEVAGDIIALLDKSEGKEPKEGDIESVAIGPLDLEIRGDAFVVLGKKDEALKCYRLELILLKNANPKDPDWIAEIEQKIEALS